jgi:hypothetical protein
LRWRRDFKEEKQYACERSMIEKSSADGEEVESVAYNSIKGRLEGEISISTYTVAFAS